MEMKRYQFKRNINHAHSPFIRMVPEEIIAKIYGFANTNLTILGRIYPFLYFCRPSAATGGEL